MMKGGCFGSDLYHANYLFLIMCHAVNIFHGISAENFPCYQYGFLLMLISIDCFGHWMTAWFFFTARFQVKKKQFFRNFMTIMLFGAVGTLISFFIISFGKLLESLVQFISYENPKFEN